MAKHSIRVDIISPFNEEDIERSKQQQQKNKPTQQNGSNQARSSRDAPDEERKTLTKQQLATQKLLERICQQTDGAVYSFDEALGLLSQYQSKAIRSAGTKYTLTIGNKLRLPIVSMIKCKESKPDIFKFKKVYAKDESVDLKMDKARFTKDEEQRDLNDKADLIDAYKYGSTYVPVDNDSDALKLKVEKCFSLLGFTKSSNVRREYFLGDSMHQIVPDAAAGDECEEAFVNMVHAMYREDCYGIVRKVYSSRSSPEMGALIPHISADLVCLYYVSLPFDDDLRKYTLENFDAYKKFTPSETQSKLVDELIDRMDLSAPKQEGDGDEEEELYDPKLTFNPYIQRMFQSIAMRGANPESELPDFDKHITSVYLSRIGARVNGNEQVKDVLKRISEQFPLRSFEKKPKGAESDENGADGAAAGSQNIFEKKKSTAAGDDDKTDLNGTLDQLLNGSRAAANTKTIGKILYFIFDLI